jgi:hypothetical protein
MTGSTNTTSYGQWLTRVIECTNDAWGRQEWQRPEDRAIGIRRLIERRYPDFDDRMQNVANLIVAVAPLVTDDGQLNAAKYKEHLQADLHRLLPFLDGSVRRDLACRLIAEAGSSLTSHPSDGAELPAMLDTENQCAS